MNLLALELATEACSIAVTDGVRVASRHEIAPRRHAELALQWSSELLDGIGLPKSSLSAIAISVGPGAFTGVRLAMAMGQGMAIALGVPLIGVSTLAVLAMSAVTDGVPSRVLAVIDARMGEIYAGRFEWDGSALRAVSDEVVVAPSLLDLTGVDASWVCVGTGIDAADGSLRARLGSVGLDATALPRAADLLRLALLTPALPPEAVTPTYLRDNVALTLAEQQARRDAKSS